MKSLQTKFYTLIILLICGLTSHAQSFIKTQGGATDVAISPKDGSVYVVGTSKNVFKYNTSTKKFAAFAKQSKDIARIAVSKTNQIYATKTNGSVVRSIGNSGWANLNMNSFDVASDKDGYLWVANKNRGGDIQQYNNSWKRPLSKVIINTDKIAPVNNRLAWVIMKDKSIQKFENGAWKTMPGAALDISVDIKTNDVYVIGTSRRIFKWNKSNKNWIPLIGTRKDFTSVDAHNGKIWATTTGKGIYYYNKNASSSSSSSSSSNSNANSTPNYAGTYRVTFTKFLGIEPNDLFGTMGAYVEAKTASGNITIKPKDRKPNRAWDISKNAQVKLRNKPVTIDSEQIINKSFRKGKDTWSHSLSIDIIREFKIEGEAANRHIVFDFQFNVKKMNFLVEEGKWQRQKIKITDLKENYEYFYYFNDGSGMVGFKIEKR